MVCSPCLPFPSFLILLQPAIHKSFLTGASDNLAEITAKSQAQHVVADNIGLALAVALGRALERLPWAARLTPTQRYLLPLALFPALAGADMFCTYREMKAVLLRNLNRPRAEIAAEEFLRTGAAPGLQAVSNREPLLLPAEAAIGGGLLPLRILPISTLADTEAELRALLRSARGRRYVLTVREAPWPLPGCGPCIAVALREDAAATDVLQAVLHAALVREEARGKPRPHWGTLADSTATRAARESRRFVASLRRQGWEPGQFLLSSDERVRYALP